LSSKAKDLRLKIARESATLLYFGLEKEYKQAKLKASQGLGARILPSNFEVAIELDIISEQIEGLERTRRLIRMREYAFKIMQNLRMYCPLLIGSVWRGTIRRGSDLDIEVYSNMPEKVVSKLEIANFKILKIEKITKNEKNQIWASVHIHGESSNTYPVEIVVRPPEEFSRKRVCDTFGDQIKGLTFSELGKLLKDNPSARFLPS
jgi:predicted nucleotidyltransferase